MINHFGLADGVWSWRWTRLGPQSGGGAAELELRGATAAWTLDPDSAGTSPRAGERLRLRPDDPRAWHDVTFVLDGATDHGPLPLPRRATDSAAYADELDLLQRLTSSRFRAGVANWPAWPVPVCAPPTPCGSLDLGACLRAAIDVWNDAAEGPSFSLAARVDTGVCLVHVPDPDLRPRMAVRWVAGDTAGRPLRLDIVVGATWQDSTLARYVVRGMVHELAHALLLWGHSEERQHSLWRCGPIVDRPARDERRAARLWRLLPCGLDLGAYGRSVELDPERHQRQRPAVEQRHRREAAVAPQGRHDR